MTSLSRDRPRGPIQTTKILPTVRRCTRYTHSTVHVSPRVPRVHVTRSSNHGRGVLVFYRRFREGPTPKIIILLRSPFPTSKQTRTRVRQLSQLRALILTDTLRQIEARKFQNVSHPYRGYYPPLYSRPLSSHIFFHTISTPDSGQG